MNVPRLEIYLNEEAKLCIAKVERLGAASSLILDVALNDLMAEGLDDASSQLGHGLINNLKLWHEDAFKNIDCPSEQDNHQHDDFDIALYLIEKSVFRKTAVHVPSIDALLAQCADRDLETKEFFDDTWPTIRKNLESFDV
jgi:hypothetical protein